MGKFSIVFVLLLFGGFAIAYSSSLVSCDTSYVNTNFTNVGAASRPYTYFGLALSNGSGTLPTNFASISPIINGTSNWGNNWTCYVYNNNTPYSGYMRYTPDGNLPNISYGVYYDGYVWFEIFFNSAFYIDSTETDTTSGSLRCESYNKLCYLGQNCNMLFYMTELNSPNPNANRTTSYFDFSLFGGSRCEEPYLFLYLSTDDTDYINHAIKYNMGNYIPMNFISRQTYSCNASAYNQYTNKTKSFSGNKTINSTINWTIPTDLVETKYTYLHNDCYLNNGTKLKITCSNGFDLNGTLWNKTNPPLGEGAFCNDTFWVRNGEPVYKISDIYGVYHKITTKPSVLYSGDYISGIKFQVRETSSGAIMSQFKSIYYNATLPNSCYTSDGINFSNGSISGLIPYITAGDNGIYSVDFGYKIYCYEPTKISMTLKVGESGLNAAYAGKATELFNISFYEPEYTMDNINAYLTNYTGTPYLTVLASISHRYNRNAVDFYADNLSCYFMSYPPNNGSSWNSSAIYAGVPYYFYDYSNTDNLSYYEYTHGFADTYYSKLYSTLVFYTNYTDLIQPLANKIYIKCNSSKYPNRKIDKIDVLQFVSDYGVPVFMCKPEQPDINYYNNAGYALTEMMNISCAISNRIWTNPQINTNNYSILSLEFPLSDNLSKYLRENRSALTINNDITLSSNTNYISIDDTDNTNYDYYNLIHKYTVLDYFFNSEGLLDNRGYSIQNVKLMSNGEKYSIANVSNLVNDKIILYSKSNIDFITHFIPTVNVNGATISILSKNNTNSDYNNSVESGDNITCFGSISNIDTTNVNANFELFTMDDAGNKIYCNPTGDIQYNKTISNVSATDNLYSAYIFVDNFSNGAFCNSSSLKLAMNKSKPLYCLIKFDWIDNRNIYNEVYSEYGSVKMFAYGNNTLSEEPDIPKKVDNWFNNLMLFYFGSPMGLLYLCIHVIIIITIGIPVLYWIGLVLIGIFGGK